MGENDIYEALGMTPPESAPGPETDGEPGQSAGGPSDERPEGEAAPETEPEEGQEPEGEPEHGKDPAREETEKARQEEFRAAVAAAAAEAVARERERSQAEWKEFFSRAGLKNTATGAAIASKEEFEDWYRSYETARLERELKEGKLTPESLQSVAERAVAERMEQRRPEPPRKPEVTQADIDRELAEIHRMDGSVNGLEDILKLETGPAFRDAVRRGHSFLDAFKLANFDRLQQQRQAEAAHRAAQAARNSAASKEHLKASTSKGSGSTPVPGDVMEMYRMMMPGASEADILAHYNRVLKEMKG